MGQKCLANGAAGVKPSKRTGNMITLEKEQDVVKRFGYGESATSVTILASIRCHSTHCFSFFGFVTFVNNSGFCFQ